jgi:hypothetical protein
MSANPIAATPAVQRLSKLPGVNILLMGPTGSGKTYFIGQLLEAGLKVRAIFTEPGMESVGKYFQDKGKEIPAEYHWHYIAPAGPDWSAMIDSADKINKMDQKGLSALSDINKGKYREFIEVLTSLSNFKSDRDGSVHGAADTWGTDTVLVIDSLSGLSMAAMNLVTGSKPIKSMGDWGMAMDNLERIVTKLTTDLRCHFIMIAHVERETDEISGGSNIMVSTLGKKLAPKIPRFFSDVILTQRVGDKFSWSTATTGVDTKARNVPISNSIPPSIDLILNSWKKNGGVIEP